MYQLDVQEIDQLLTKNLLTYNEKFFQAAGNWAGSFCTGSECWLIYKVSAFTGHWTGNGLLV